MRETALEGHMLGNVVRFAGVLRSFGVRAGTSEVRDAVAALDEIGLRHRGEVKAALRATLVKSFDDARIFDLAFEAFFSQEVFQAREDSPEARHEDEEAGRAAKEELRFCGQALGLQPELYAAYVKMDPEERQRIAGFIKDLSKGLGGTEKSERFKPLLERIIKSRLERWMDLRASSNESGVPVGDVLLSRMIAAGLGGGLAAGPGPFSAADQDLAAVGEADMPMLERLTAALVRRLAAGISRRHKAGRLRDILDFRRTVRANIKFGGELLDLRYRSRKPSKPSIWLVCDVSGSMSKYAAFVLKFAFGLASAAKGMEAFLFSEDLEYVTPRVRQWASKGSVISFLREVSSASVQWGRGTDVGRSLGSLMSGYGSMLSTRLTVIVVSDAKTVATERAARSLESLRRRCREVLWLLTLPKDQWARVPAVSAFEPHCRLLECYTLSHLHKIMKTEVFG